MLQAIKNILGGRASLDAEIADAEKELATWSASRDRVQAEHTDALAREGQLTAEARSERDLAAVQQAQRERGALRDRLDVLQSRVDIEQSKLRALVARRDDSNLAQRWADFEAALDARQKALALMVKNTEALVKSLLDAEAAAAHAYDLLPVRNDPRSTAAQSFLAPSFTRLEPELGRLLSFLSEAKLGSYKGDYSCMFEDRKQPWLLERAAIDARELMAMSPFNADRAA